MKINRSMATAVFLGLLLAGWFWYNSNGKAEEKPPVTTESPEKSLPTVVTRLVTAMPHAAKIKIFGRSETSREVMINAATAGAVISTPVSEGRFVRKGTIVCRQNVNARQAMLDQANAKLRSREVDFTAAERLVERGFASENQALSAQAALDAAKATVKQAEIELENINIRAPFSGVYEKQIAELGDYLVPGQACGQLIELNPLNISVDLTENQLALVSKGQSADIELATGEMVVGTVNLIESGANPATRTFRAEIKVDNPDNKLKAGVTASVKLNGAEKTAHSIPAYILSLNDNGVVGVKYMDGEFVRFAAVETIDETGENIWVTGLPDKVDIIVQGQEFVTEGIKAQATDEYAQ